MISHTDLPNSVVSSVPHGLLSFMTMTLFSWSQCCMNVSDAQNVDPSGNFSLRTSGALVRMFANMTPQAATRETLAPVPWMLSRSSFTLSTISGWFDWYVMSFQFSKSVIWLTRTPFCPALIFSTLLPFFIQSSVLSDCLSLLLDRSIQVSSVLQLNTLKVTESFFLCSHSIAHVLQFGPPAVIQAF